MKKIAILVLMLSVFNSFYSQTNSGKIVYSVRANPDLSSTVNPDKKQYNAFNNELMSLSTKAKFKLEFNLEKSQFGLIENLPLDITDFKTKMAIMLVKGNRSFFFDAKNGQITEQKKILSDNILIKTKYEDYNWKLTKQSKLIGDYLCYKASRNYKHYGKGNKELEASIIVWYCPTLPYNYGPFESSGLPGLVLMYETKGFIYTASEVNLSKKIIDIDIPTKGKFINSKKYDSIIKEKVMQYN